MDCQLLQITIFSAINYNIDGEAAPELTIIENFVLTNIDMSDLSTKEPVMNIDGFKMVGHRLKNVTFSKILVPENLKIVINNGGGNKM